MSQTLALKLQDHRKHNWLREKKSHITNFVALLCVVVGYVLPKYGDILVSAGYFAFSGAITNWLAVHMLFEKVPFLYGSGVIPLRFSEFKTGIKNLILEQFFTTENIQRFLTTKNNSDEITNKINSIDTDKIYTPIVEAIMQSPFKSMLGMLGGEKALEPIKEPIINKLKLALISIAENDLSQYDTTQISTQLRQQIEQIVTERLDELTPQHVKLIIQDMIQKHLGWLVVWGGIFGGLIGATIAIFPSI